MALPRFLVDIALDVGAAVELPAAVTHHASRVLRLRAGDEIILFNGRGGEFLATLGAAAGPGAPFTADVLEFDPVERETRIRITLVQALTSAEKTDWIVEKAVEIGVARLIVAPSERSTVKLDAERRARRLSHWRDLAESACCQSGRNRLMAVEAADSLQQALALVVAEARFILDPDPTAASAATVIPDPMPTQLALAIGPEGGFSSGELAQAVHIGYRRMRLGTRVLRTETAGLAACAACLALAGEYSSSGE